MKTYHLPKQQEEFRPMLPIFKKHDGDNSYQGNVNS